jgi:four helix bundle protein
MSELNLKKFDLYLMAREYGRLAWKVFSNLPQYIQWKTGWQFLESADSVQANIAEAYGRYHFKDKRNFEFNSRGSLTESMSWIEILYERGFVAEKDFEEFTALGNAVSVKLNNHISYLASQIALTKP